uniref:ABC transporter domain-containing protein n=1 Tax=Ananas comosus var. bracteatus TaxID=296719 RepID=A0A6V7NZT7_ANACO|nr:unnamed protein product [Ananas comosus var. bracteatus]
MEHGKCSRKKKEYFAGDGLRGGDAEDRGLDEEAVGEDVFSRSSREEDDEEALKWAALEKLPTYDRVRRAILALPEGERREVDVAKLGFCERKALLERLVRVAEDDNEAFLSKLKDRIDRVGIEVPTIEVRFEHLNVTAETYVGNRGLPTLLNSTINTLEDDFAFGSTGRRKDHLTLDLGRKTRHPTKEMLTELARREKAANIKPDPDIDAYMKASAVGSGKEANVVTDYILKILGLEICADTLVGNDMLRGISGGQKKRLTTGEMLVGPARALFMDEISTGLDSSTTFQIVNSLRQSVHILGGTAVISLLQPAPETYELFDDIILISDGQIAYQGPRECVLEFFESMGFRCPERKGVADFLQEVTSRKDQQQYWARHDETYRYVPVTKFAEAFCFFHVGRNILNELAVPFDKGKSHPAALTTSKYGVSRKELLRANIDREILLMKRNSFMYIFRATQVSNFAHIIGIRDDDLIPAHEHAPRLGNGRRNLHGGAVLRVLMIMFNGFSELAMTIVQLPVFFKQRDLLLYPTWTYTIPSWILKIPVTFVEVGAWVFMTYYVIGFDPNVGRFCKQYLLFLALNQMASSLFRFIGGLGRDMVVANTFGSCALLIVMVLGGFILSREEVKKWWIWGYWISPLMYAQNAISTNEFLGHSWSKVLPGSSEPLGVSVLKSRGVFTEAKWYWIGFGALIGYTVLFNALFTAALAYLKPFGKAQPVVSEETLKEKRANLTGEGLEKTVGATKTSTTASSPIKKGMVLPFVPLSLTFENIRYSVDMPQEMRAQGVTEDRLELLKGISGSFRPGVLTALMGVSGAGKSTLMDVLADVYRGGHGARRARFGERCSCRIAGVNGLSTEQRKRLTIAVELVANPSIIFMDEPTSGLDARAAAIVMRTVRNTVDTGRTVVCTIHQPSIDIFDAFDELFVMKRGGEEIYVGPLGHHSSHLIKYFEGIEGVSKIKDGYNPATWMLEVTTPAQEEILGVNFGEIYKNSELYQRNRSLIKELSTPQSGSSDLYFPTQYSQSFLTQCMACLWKQNLSYWRNPPHNAVRFFFTTATALLFGTIFWDLGTKRRKQQDVFNAMGSMYAAVLFVGFQNSTSIQPIVAIERTVFYRERAAGMYSALPYAFGQRIPVWWRWYYWINPVAWTLYGLVVSQFGDIEHHLDSGETVAYFVRDYFGFRHDFLGVVAVVVVAFAVLFAFLFAFAIRMFNFQKR